MSLTTKSSRLAELREKYPYDPISKFDEKPWKSTDSAARYLYSDGLFDERYMASNPGVGVIMEFQPRPEFEQERSRYDDAYHAGEFANLSTF